jgi:hypothetical protein
MRGFDGFADLSFDLILALWIFGIFMADGGEITKVAINVFPSLHK